MSKPEFNLLVPVEYEAGGEKRTRWVRFGSLWKSKEGNSYGGKVDFWPLGVDGNRVVLMPPKDGGADPETGEISEDDPAF